ncbi:MAG: Aspartyl-tRNA synthetase [Parcubacteria group bacterium GW2011_GWA1_42_7]|nr:MAG: Aspartyl-tRNA synthetase [Parcubacteria group bacterium GW2011_GWB1_42_6]KKS70238.1 MAG: Aspartyl-tRNA synthetase [Parcubacteria group bacterium GW2011_GWA1_42_7]KKS92587.1 MAG: Aspartyl-tRNA synthetase [Parcubacteria group bacterium GW2011_GWC1_43_12]
MERTLIDQLKNHINEEVLIKGRVMNVRGLSNVKFVLVQDYKGLVQTVWETEIFARIGDAVEVIGEVREDKRAKGGVEIFGKELKITAPSIEDLPFDLSKPDLNLQLATLLDYRPLSLRHPKVQQIFRLYDLLLESYDKAMREECFIEIKTPKILEAASEGGANFFKLEYFDKNAYLAQSPQFFKQIMVGVFERVFEIGPAFRAEPHFTTRHVNEYISLDAEMGFIDDFGDVMAMLNKILAGMFGHMREKSQNCLEAYGAEIPKVPEKIPQIKLAQIKKIIKEKYNYEIPETTDIDPEGERLAGRWAKEEFNSDFLFITHYPWSDRPFYTMPDKDNPAETCGFDLIYKGLEIATGSQRINDYKMLMENMAKKNISPDGMEYYLDIFKYAMPPHGGWGMGSERIIQQMLGLKSIKEAILFPRDMKRLSP